jgi:hypothetical protein
MTYGGLTMLRLARAALLPEDDVQLMAAALDDALRGQFDEITYAQLPRVRAYFGRVGEAALAAMADSVLRYGGAVSPRY